MNPIEVGIIGASEQSWAAMAHVPAIQSLPDFHLKGIATSHLESARSAARTFGADLYFGDYRQLVEHPEVQLVVVAVNVPKHREAVEAALNTGKIVFCEWPLTIGLDAAESIVDQARRKRVRTVIGLQARFSPAIKRARELVRDGYIGEVMGTALVGSATLWGPEVSAKQVYAFDAVNGATALTTTTIHALDAIASVLGEFSSVSARFATRRREVIVKEDGSRKRVTAPDQMAISATLESGAIASVFYRGGISRGDNMRWEINGTKGDLVITSQLGNVQVAPLKLEGGREGEDRVRQIEVTEAQGGIGANVRSLYDALAGDIRENSQMTPDFRHALRRHRLLAALEKANETGVAQRPE